MLFHELAAWAERHARRQRYLACGAWDAVLNDPEASRSERQEAELRRRNEIIEEEQNVYWPSLMEEESDDPPEPPGPPGPPGPHYF